MSSDGRIADAARGIKDERDFGSKTERRSFRMDAPLRIR